MSFHRKKGILLHNHSSVIKFKKFVDRLWLYHIQTSQIILIKSFLENLLWSRIPFSHANALRAWYLVSVILKQYQRLSLTFTTSAFVKSTGWLFFRVSFNLGFSDVSSFGGVGCAFEAGTEHWQCCVLSASHQEACNVTFSHYWWCELWLLRKIAPLPLKSYAYFSFQLVNP